MKHLILGTAGHVDHGKTSLIRALTGFDCDTHIEEQKRGITIHLGFTNILLDDGNQIGIIDVPGHKDFVNTMIAGASGIDFVMLVIAADSGIMPQTREHLKIMQLLDIKSGFIALTKSDLVDDELVQLAIAEIEEFTQTTFLEACPIITVSSKTGLGLDDIRKEIKNQIAKTEERDLGLIFRMYIDRIFTSEGYGTIINGSILSGKIIKQDQISLLPIRKELRIRSMQKFHKEVEELKAGDRASLNIVGLKKSEFKRGMLITNYDREASIMLDCLIYNFSTKILGLWTTVIFLSGTFKSKAKIHLIDKDELHPLDKGIVQITLDIPGFFFFNDKLIIRDSSNEFTLGGGTILDAFPLKHRKRPVELINKLHNLTNNNIRYVLLNEIEKSIDVQFSIELSYKLNVKEEIIKKAASELSNEITVIKENNSEIYIQNSLLEKIEKEIIKIVKNYRMNNLLSNKGISFTEISKYLLSFNNNLNKNSLRVIFENMANNNKLLISESTYLPLKDLPTSSKSLENIKADVLFFIRSFKSSIPEDSNKDFIKNKFKIKTTEFNSIINALLEEHKIIYYDNLYLSTDVLDDIIDKIRRKFGNDKFRIADVRDLLEGNRKIALYFLELFDKMDFTRRIDEFRVLTDKKLI